MKDIELWLGDCLELMNNIPDNSVDLILADLPYGTTACRWDIIIPFVPLWKQYKRIRKKRTPILLFAQTPFDKVLGMSNISELKYEWIWKKHQGTNPMLAKKSPMKVHENILVFYKKAPLYNPQMTNGKPYGGFSGTKKIGEVYGEKTKSIHRNNLDGSRYPLDVLEFRGVKKGKHPTQKPVELLEYFLKTYTNENDLVLDNTMGVGSTMVACKNTNRRGIGIEKEKKYFDIAVERLQ